MTYKPDGERVLKTLRYLYEAGYWGATWHELADSAGMHHGQASGVLSTLHKEGRISRLKDKRGNCSIYVDNAYVDERETVPYGRKRNNYSEAEIDKRVDEIIGQARATINAMAMHTGSKGIQTHYKGCWKVHVPCALRTAALQLGRGIDRSEEAA